ncbi:MAG: YgcG family protein [Bacteroidales bacterium]|nr:YgcG family protein [Bacteroidales bacterium]
MKRVSLYLFIYVFITVFPALHGAEVPYLTGRVVDNAQILTDQTRRSLTEILKDHESRTTNQIVVLTIPSLDGENIEDYSNRVFNDWKLGQKDKNNGIIIVIVPGERRMRIEVGYGLEGTMTDLLAGRIIRDVMAPRFRGNDYDGGITEGTMAVLTVLEGGELALPEDLNTDSDNQAKSAFGDFEDPNMPLAARILIGAFIFGIIGMFTLIGIFTPGFGWFLYLFLIPFWAMFPIIVLGTRGALICFIIYLVVFPIAKLIFRYSPKYEKLKQDLKAKGKASIGGFTFSSGSTGRSWSSGSSRSGGGFSGGGGSSGGGGASGGW